MRAVNNRICVQYISLYWMTPLSPPSVIYVYMDYCSLFGFSLYRSFR